MLRNPTAAAVDTTDELVEHEYQKLKCAWEQQRYDTKPQQQETQHHPHDTVQFTLMHLFHGYLNQIWMDSQNMLQCAQSWNNDPHQKEDAAFTMNILGLHLMKQSLRTRQELFHIMGEVSSASSSSSSNHHDVVPARASSSTTLSSCSVASYYQLPVKLSSSPSTPTIHNAGSMDPYWQLDLLPTTATTTTTCKHAFTPGSNYPSYFPVELEQNTSCHFCHEKLVGLKKSFSADHFSTLASQISSEEEATSSSSSDGEGGVETQAVYECFHNDTSNSNSTFDLESIEEDMLASRKLLVQDEDDNEKNEGNYSYQQKLLKYQLIRRSELHESSKLELEDDDTSVSSTGTTSMEEARMKRSTINNNVLHERIDSSSTCLPESVYSSDGGPCHCEQQKEEAEQTMPRKKRNLSMFFIHHNNSAKSSTTKPSFKDKLKRYRSKDATDKNAIPRSLSYTLCQLFTTSQSTTTSSSIKRQQQQQF